MRYFTLDLVRALYGDPPGADTWAADEWNHRSAQYRDELARLRPSLPPRLVDFIEQGSLYEYHLESSKVLSGDPDPVLQVRNALEIELVLSYGEVRRTLHYRNVKLYALRMDTGAPLMRRAEPAAALLSDTWLYDEISLAGPGLVRHKALLASGGFIEIIFEKFDFS